VQPPAGWDYTSRLKTALGCKEQIDTFDFDDPITGYHGHGDNGYLRYHRVSLSRLLHGDNGRLIKNQAELDGAIAKLLRMAKELGRPAIPTPHFTRVDLAWQFADDPARFVLAHRHCRHPRIHADAVCHGKRSLYFKGAEMRITMYDKIRERHHRDGDIVRVEVQLHGERLKEELGRGDRVTALNFDACYEAYRRTLLGFVPPAIPAVGNIAQFLAIGEQDGWQHEGVPAFDVYTAGMSERNMRRLRQDMARLIPSVHGIDWRQLLPADGPPAPVEIELINAGGAT
jgi:hypothetical protein